MKITLLALCAILTLKSELIAGSEISQNRAHHLAAGYFARYVSGCGGVEAPVLRGEYWDAPVRFGVAGTLRGSIRVERRSGTVSYRWAFQSYPTVSAESLETWTASLKKRSRAP